MKRMAGVIFVLLAPVLARADAITNTVCSVTSNSVTEQQTNSSGCSVTFGTINGGFANASISSTENLPAPGSPSSPVSASFNGSVATGTVQNGPGNASASAEATGSSDMVLSTVGPVRQGEIQLDEAVTLISVGAPTPVNIAVGSLSAHCTDTGTGAPADCTGNLGPSNGHTTGEILPFTLGQQFVFHEDIDQSAANSDSDSIGHSAMGSVEFGFTLLESNGTPVQIQAVPEPKTVLLLVVGLIALFCTRPQRYW